jgi:hypothetical protein
LLAFPVALVKRFFLPEGGLVVALCLCRKR